MFARHAPAFVRVLDLRRFSALPKANLTWGMCSKHCTISSGLLQLLTG